MLSRYDLFAGALLLSVGALFAACGGGSSGEAPDLGRVDTGVSVPDAVSDVGTVEVVEADTVREPDGDDIVEDTGADVPPDAADPEFVFEDRESDLVIADDPVIEEVATLYRTVEVLADLDVRALAMAEGAVWVGTPSGLFYYDYTRDDFREFPLPSAPDPAVVDLASDGGIALFVAHPAGVTFVDLEEGTGEYVGLADGIRCVAVGPNSVWAGGDAGAGPVQPLEPWNHYVTDHPVRALAFPEGAGWPVGATVAGLVVFSAEGPTVRDAAGGFLPDDDVRTLAAAGDGKILAGTATGLSLVDLDAGGCAIVPEVGERKLPEGEVTALDVAGDWWLIGHAIGATAWRPAGECPADALHVDHYHTLRWMPDDEVRDVVLAADGTRWIGTAGGVARIQLVERTLAEKAAFFEDWLEAHNWRAETIVASDAIFDSPWEVPGPHRNWDTDNDGLWTQMQIGAWALAYGATGDPVFCERARQAIRGMFLLVDIPAIDFEAAGRGRGFVARSVVRDDEGEVFSSKAVRSNWHLVHHEGHDYYWKDDTSSDEIAGHFFGYPLHYDLCAETAEEKAAVADHAGAIAAYIRDNGFRLIDLDGGQTGHGVWEPERLAITLDGLFDCGDQGHTIEDCGFAFGGGGWLNATEILGTMLAAFHMTGDPTFYEAYETLVTGHRYAELVDFQPTIMTVTEPGVANHSDHELAMLAYFTLIRYEPNPERRQRWIDSMLAVYEYIRPERNALWGLLVASATHDAGDFEDSARTLHEIPLDLRKFAYDKRHRQDVQLINTDRFGDQQFNRVVPYDENKTFWWNSNPYKANDGGNPTETQNPMFWLLPYYGLRYYGVIQ